MKDYATEARQRLVGRIHEKPLVGALASALPIQLSIAELVFDQLKNERGIDSAIGVQLDRLGEIVGELRLGRSDDAYRRALRLRIFINISKGRPSDLIYALKESTQASVVQYLEAYPASVYLYTSGFDAYKGIESAMQDVAPAAIGDIPVAVSFGEKPLRVVGLTADSAKLGKWVTLDQRRIHTLSGKTILVTQGLADEYGLGGVQLGVFVGLTGRRIVGLTGRRLRIKQNYRVIPSYEKLTGVYQA